MSFLTESEIFEILSIKSARYDKHQKIHDAEVDKLFGVKNLTSEQYRWLGKGYRHFAIFDIEAMAFDARMGFMICWYNMRWDILTGEREMIYDQLEPADADERPEKNYFEMCKMN